MASGPVTFSSRRRQRGQGLISMMVGLVISLITISAMLVLYKTMIEVSGNASRSALRDGQVSSALLAAQMEMQSAGFGVPSGDALSTKLAIRDAGKELVWRYKTGLTASGFQCSGLRLVDGNGLYRLAEKKCNTVADINWSTSEMELMAGSAAFFTPVQKDGTAYNSTESEVGAVTLAPGYTFSLKAKKQCLPYMQQDFSTSPGAVTGQQIALEGNDLSRRLFLACLPNLAVSTT